MALVIGVVCELCSRWIEPHLLGFAAADVDYRYHTYRYPRGGEHQALAVGDSRIGEGFIASRFEEQTGMSAVNLAVSGGTVVDIDAIVRRLALPHETALRVVIIGLSPFMLNEKAPLNTRAPRYLWTLSDAWSHHWSGMPPGPDGSTELCLESQVSRHLSIFRRRDEVYTLAASGLNDGLGFQLLRLDRHPDPSLAELYADELGYARRGRLAQHRLDRTPPSEGTAYPALSGFEPSEGRLVVLERLVDTLRERGVVVLVILTPVSSRMETLWTQEIRDDVESALERLARRGAVVLHPSLNECDLSDRDFYDPDHLAPEGGRKLTDYVVDHLERVAS